MFQYYVKEFTVVDYEGESAYYLISIEAAVEYIMKIRIGNKIRAEAFLVFGLELKNDSKTTAASEYEGKCIEKLCDNNYTNTKNEEEEASGDFIALPNASYIINSKLQLELSDTMSVLSDVDSISQYSSLRNERLKVVDKADEETIVQLGVCICKLYSTQLLTKLIRKMIKCLPTVSTGLWLRDQQVMEDTISGLEREGWMV